MIILDEKLAITLLLKLIVDCDESTKKKLLINESVAVERLFDQKSVNIIKDSIQFIISQCLEYILVNSTNYKQHQHEDSKISELEVDNNDEQQLAQYVYILENLLWFMKSLFFLFFFSFF